MAVRRSDPAHRVASNESISGPEALFTSPAAEAIKEEILHAGKKLWQRAYVDGNGGNISARISDEYVICTPTLCSKGDMQAEDLSLVDLNNCQICGDRPQTSEILLHLEILQGCAPSPEPSSTAIRRMQLPTPWPASYPAATWFPSRRFLLGRWPWPHMRRPGPWHLRAPFCPSSQDHNTILLTNHGVVCWADTVDPRGVVRGSGRELLQDSADRLPVGSPRSARFPANKIGGLLAMKEKLGLARPRGCTNKSCHASFANSRAAPRQRCR